MDENINLIDYEGSYTGSDSGSGAEYYYPGRDLLTTSPDPDAVSASGSDFTSFADLFSSLFGASGSNFDSSSMNELFDQYKQFILDNTNYNNAWSAEQAEKMMDFQRSEREWSQMFNAGEAAKNRDWQEYMSNTAHQREIADLKAAGLNPVLSAKGGNGAPVTSGATAAGSTPGHGAQGNPDQSANSAITGFLGTAFSAMTNMASKMVDAQTSLAVAAKYTDMERIIESMKEEYGKWEHENYPSSMYEAISAVLHGLGLGSDSSSGSGSGSGSGIFSTLLGGPLSGKSKDAYDRLMDALGSSSSGRGGKFSGSSGKIDGGSKWHDSLMDAFHEFSDSLEERIKDNPWLNFVI